MLRDRSLITGREGLQNGKIAVWNFLRPPQDKVKLFAPFRFKEWKLFAPPLVWLKRQVPVLKLAQNLFVTPPPNIAWLKLPPPLFFCRGKTSISPPPLPVIDDRSLIPATRWSCSQHSLLAGGRLQLHLVAGIMGAQRRIT